MSDVSTVKLTDLPDGPLDLPEPEQYLGTTVILRNHQGFPFVTFLSLDGWFLYNWGWSPWEDVVKYLNFGEYESMTTIRPEGAITMDEGRALAQKNHEAWLAKVALAPGLGDVELPM